MNINGQEKLIKYIVGVVPKPFKGSYRKVIAPRLYIFKKDKLIAADILFGDAANRRHEDDYDTILTKLITQTINLGGHPLFDR